jgi:TolB-like protein
MSFFAELKRRKVIRVGIAYVIGGWLLLQLTEVLSELLNLPEQVGPVVVAVVAIGLPIALFLAWAFELTSDGLKRDSDVTPEQRSSGKVINVIVVGLLLAALGYFIWESRFRVEEADTPASETTGFNTTTFGETIETPVIGRSIAVLPFENFGTAQEDQYFADGLTDTLLHKLAQIEELKVIARNSSFQFKGTNRDIREIGEILGVDTVLEGSVQRAGDQVRIIAQLIRTSDGVHIWSESFDDSIDNIFALQDRIAEDIVDQFEVSLSAAERQRLLRNGTESPEAYDLLIRALNQPRNLDQMTDSTAEEDEKVLLLLQAIEIDPGYTLAWAHLSRAYNGLAFAADSAQDYERYTQQSLAAAQQAIELDANLAMSHNAMGWVSHRLNETLEAARHFRRALEIDPNSLEAMSGLALQLGWSDPEEALKLLERAHELDPTSSIVHRQKHFALMALGRRDEAIVEIKRAIELDPAVGMYYRDLLDLLEHKGRPDEGARFTSRLLAQVPDSFEGQMAMAEAWLATMDFERSRGWIELIMRNRTDSDTAKRLNAERLIAAGQFQAALDQIDDVVLNSETANNIQRLRISACLGAARQECVLQDLNRFRDNLETARSQGNVAPEFEAYPALVNVLLNELTDSGSESPMVLSRLLDLIVANRYFGGTAYARAGLLARQGDNAAALLVLEETIADPEGGVFNRDMFGLDVEQSPLLNPLRNEPAFIDWLERYRARREAMLKRMIQMEVSGEIQSIATAERALGS